MKLIREASRNNYRDVEDEWKWEFVFYVLDGMGIPEEELEECVPEDGNYSNIQPEHKIKLRRYANKRDFTIIDDRDGGIKIYAYIPELEEHFLAAEWKKCKFVFKEDLKEIDPNKRIYVEIQADVYITFDDEE